MTNIDQPELDRRAQQIVSDSDGIFPVYEPFYIHSIMYAADRVIESFERYQGHLKGDSPDPDIVSAVHESMGHAAALSRFFWPSGAGPRAPASLRRLAAARAAKLRYAFRMEDSSPLRDRALRDALEHFDERVDRYLLSSDAGQYMPVPRVGDSSSLPNEHQHIFKLVDTERQVFLILDRKFSFGPICAEAERVLLAARKMSKAGDRLNRDLHRPEAGAV